MSKEAMKRFLIETSVENAEGSQTWYVDATSEAEALKKYEQGGCDLYASNVDVTSLGEPEISGETTLDDFGDFSEQPAQPLTDANKQFNAAIDFAIEQGSEAALFLRHWREGDTAEWPEFDDYLAAHGITKGNT